MKLGREAVEEVIQNIFAGRDVDLNVVPLARIDIGEAARQQCFPGRDDLHHGGMAGQPGRMRVARIQGWVFQQAQAPTLCRLLGCLWPTMTAPPVEPVVGMPAQVFPGERKAIQMQHVQVCGSRIPMREVMRIDHDASSCEQDSPPRKNYALHRHRQSVMG